MAIKRTSHAVYDTKYHLVWAPKYRRWIVRADLRQRAAELFREIAEDFGFDINEMEVAKDHVHILLDFPPRYSISKVVGILKSISTSRLWREFPELRQHRSRAFWEDGYFARTVGDQVTAEVVKQYIRYQSAHRAGWVSARSVLGGLGAVPPIENSSSDEGQVESEQGVVCGAHLPEEAPPFGRGASLVCHVSISATEGRLYPAYLNHHQR